MLSHTDRRNGSSSFWVLVALSLAVVGGLLLLLWQPWENRGVAGNKTLVMYYAAGMAKPVQDTVKKYEDEYNVKIILEPGGTGKLLSTLQVNRGKGAHLFLAADRLHMETAQKEGLVAETIPVAHLEAVLVVNKDVQDRLIKEGKPITGIKDILRDDVKMSLANPEMAAIGLLAKRVLESPEVNIWPELKKDLEDAGTNRVSTVGTVNEVITAVRTGAADVGIVWKANARMHKDLKVVDVPQFTLDENKELVQIGVLTAAEEDEATSALQFARYLSAKDKGGEVFKGYDYSAIPDADVWDESPTIYLSSGSMLKPGIDDVVKAFEKREGVEINTTYNGCGILVSQMRSMKEGGDNDRFPDAYFSCDVSFLTQVQDYFDAAVNVSKNDLVLLVKKGNPLNIKNLDDLLRSDVKKIGFGHPQNAAMGALTENLLKKVGLHDKIYADGWQDRIVHADAGHDLVNKFRVGALDAAIVYRSNALSTPENVEKHMDIVDIDIAEALATQPFAIAKDSQHKYMMRRLLRAIVADQSADRFRTLGFHWIYDTKDNQ